MQNQTTLTTPNKDPGLEKIKNDIKWLDKNECHFKHLSAYVKKLEDLLNAKSK